MELVNRIAFLLGKGLRDLMVNKWEQAVTLVALTLLLFLGLMFILVVFNVSQQVISRQGEISFEIYWESSDSLDEVRKQWDWLEEKGFVQSLATYTPGKALKALDEGLGGHNLGWLKSNNPLPPTAVVSMKVPRESPKEAVRRFVRQIEGKPGVSRVSLDSKELRKASMWTSLSEKAFYPSLAGIIFLVAIIMGNTFKLTLYTKQEEVEVLRLVGAGRWFIQLPLFVGAVVQALIGGGLALGLLRVAQNGLNGILDTPPLWLELSFLPLQHVAAFFGVLVVVAVVSSWVAIRNY
jgi:cell division transport system permease protein